MFTRVYLETNKLFDSNLLPIILYLDNGTVNSIFMQQFFFSLRSFSILNLNIIYELNNWPKNPSNNFTLKECFIMHTQIIKKSNYK